MKCKCGLELEQWQTSLLEGRLIKRYRCICGEPETVEIIEPTKPKVIPPKEDKEDKE